MVLKIYFSYIYTNLGGGERIYSFVNILLLYLMVLLCFSWNLISAGSLPRLKYLELTKLMDIHLDFFLFSSKSTRSGYDTK